LTVSRRGSINSQSFADPYINRRSIEKGQGLH